MITATQKEAGHSLQNSEPAHLQGAELDRFLELKSTHRFYSEVYKKPPPVGRFEKLSNRVLSAYKYYLIRKGLALNLWHIPF